MSLDFTDYPPLLPVFPGEDAYFIFRGSAHSRPVDYFVIVFRHGKYTIEYKFNVDGYTCELDETKVFATKEELLKSL